MRGICPTAPRKRHSRPKSKNCPARMVSILCFPMPDQQQIRCTFWRHKPVLSHFLHHVPSHAGDAMPTYAICEVMQSNSPKIAVGDIVASEATWSDYRHFPTSCPSMGSQGKTAYHGLMSIGNPVAGETVLVSAAAGSVGGYVGQIAKALGCRVVGIAGGPEKCKWVVDEMGFDACIDYREAGLSKALSKACPNGVDVYFDNVGGKILESSLNFMNEKGRVVCCGAISQYDTDNPTGPRNLPGVIVVKRLKMEGFICIRAMQHWVGTGQIKVTEDIVDGLENAPQALIGLLAGDNKGKRLVRVAPDPS
ncbi:NADPH-dependent curcumin reductase [Nymphon striatum]|nr:NADPH-dependent curcumin reductase [Nymphon striatum]